MVAMSRHLPFPFPPRVGRRRGRRSKRRGDVARMAASAVRIPDARLTAHALRFAATGPQIFVHEGARQSLERRFSVAYRGPVVLAVTDNSQAMITQSRARGTLRVRVHMMFLDAPERVQEALVHYAVAGDREASRTLGNYIDANSHRIRASRPVVGPLRTRGRFHDLRDLFARLNEAYFGGTVTGVLVTWGRRTRPKNEARATIKLGSYSAPERLIRVHPVLDRPWVPRYFVAYIVYHELLHHVIPMVRTGRRSIVHSPAFLREERAFRRYDRAIAWEKSHLGRLLRAA